MAAKQITIEVKGLKEAMKSAKASSRFVVEEVKKALVSIGNDVQRTMVDSVRAGGKTGRLYVKANGIQHRASAPGEAPATDTGALVRSIAVFPDLNRLEVEIGVKAPLMQYAESLEFGTSRMEPRPFIIPAGDKNLDKAAEKLNLALERGLANAARG